MIDTHCHILSDDYDNIEEEIVKIKNSGVSKIIINGVDMKSNLEVLELTKKYEIVYGAIGFHPTDSYDINDEDINWLDKHINDDKIVALGEIGLDYHYEDTDKNKQQDVFKKQLEIAKKHDKPIIVHCRDAICDTYNILKEYDLRGSMHCYSGSLEMAREFIKLGFLIGVGGVITYKNAKNIKEVIKNINLEYILLETDSPYLTPEPYRGKKNSSCYIPLIADVIAEIKNIDRSLVETMTTNNANGLFDF